MIYRREPERKTLIDSKLSNVPTNTRFSEFFKIFKIKNFLKLVDTISVPYGILTCLVSRWWRMMVWVCFLRRFSQKKNGVPKRKKTLTPTNFFVFWKRIWGIFFPQSYSAMFCRHYDGSDFPTASSHIYIYIYISTNLKSVTKKIPSDPAIRNLLWYCATVIGRKMLLHCVYTNSSVLIPMVYLKMSYR